MVQTIDFFTPIIDDPYDFGRVAAANAISDVYAMGAKPVTALAVLAFPLGELPNEVISSVMQGACDVIEKAGAALAGGHSIDDDTLKFGLSVTGLVHPDRVWSNQGALAGDRLILTKPLGTGTLTAGLKRDALNIEDLREAIESMATLNDAIVPLEAKGLANAIHAATDVTGFGFSGHSTQLAKASGVRLRISGRELPRLERAMEGLEKGWLTKAHRTNREYTQASIDVTRIDAITELLLHDPQTSGGLLLSVEADRAEAVLEVLREKFPHSQLIGSVESIDARVGEKLVIVE